MITLLLGALIGCWYAYNQNKSSKQHLNRMIKDMESLQKAETALEDLQVLYICILFYYYHIQLINIIFRKNLKKQNKNKNMLALKKQI